jgi:adenosylhomocysteine nucleosidase
MGQKRAGTAAEAVLREWRPDLLVMAGVAGALAPDLSMADVIVADGIVAGHELHSPSLVPSVSTRSHHTGRLLSLDRVLVTADDKRVALAALLHSSAPLAVEMETAAVAQVAACHGVPWAAIRAVSDTADESLPLDFNRLRSPDGDLPTARVALAALSSPTAIPGLIRLGKNTGLAAEAVARFLEHWISSL